MAKSVVPPGRVPGIKRPVGSPASAAATASARMRKVPGVSPTVALTRGVTIESAKQHQIKKQDARAAELGVPVGTLIRVRATRTGYYNDQRWREGDVFKVPAELFSHKWMERADGAKLNTKPTGPNAAIAREHDAILGGTVTRDVSGDDESDDDGPTGPADQ